MKTIFALILCSVLISCADKTFDKDFLAFEIRLAESHARVDCQNMILYNTDQTFFVCGPVYLSNTDIKSTKITDWETHPKVEVMLNDSGRIKFAEFTGSNIGKRAAMIVDGKLISAPVINAGISEGKLIIAGFFDHEEAMRIIAGILPGKNH